MKPEGERIASLEAQMNDLNRKVDTIADDVKEIKKLLLTAYVTKNELNEVKKNIWLERIVTIITTAVITALVMGFLSKGV